MVLVVEILVVAALVFVVAALAVGWFDRMAPAPPDATPTGLPAAGPVSADEVSAIRLNMALRGYRMAEVDALLTRLAGELAWRDEELARRDDELVRLAAFAQADAPGQPEVGPAAGPTAYGPTPPITDNTADWDRPE